MIAAVEPSERNGSQQEQQRPRRKRRRPDVAVEVRLVIDLRLPGQREGAVQRTFWRECSGAADSEPVFTGTMQAEEWDRPQSPSCESQEIPPTERRANGIAAAAPVMTPPEAPTDSPSSLLDLYRSSLRDKRRRSAGDSAIAEHESSMRAFDEFASKNLRLLTPVVTLKEPEVLRAFSAYLIRTLALSASTTSKRLTHVAMIAKSLTITVDKPTPDEIKRLWYEAQAEKRSQSAVSSPEIERRIPSFAEIDALARHVANASYPYGKHAPYFWRGWIRFLALIGPRSRDVVSVKPCKPGLRKEDVIFDTLCPIPDVSNALGYELHSPHGWLWYVISKDQHSDCRKILFPMTKWLRDWIRFFFEFSHDPERVFPSVQKASVALSQKQMTAQWNALLKAANVDSRLIPSEGTGGRIALRKFAANWWSLATLNQKSDSALADKMAHYVLHHAEVTTSNKHYLSTQAAVLPVMLQLLPTWPVPAAGAQPVSLLPE